MATLISHIRLYLFRFPAIAVKAAHPGEGLCDKLAFFILYKLTGKLLFHLIRILMLRQQHRRFDLNQAGRHIEKFSGYLQILLLHQLHMLHILLQKLGYKYIVYIQFILFDQMQQKVKRALKYIQSV